MRACMRHVLRGTGALLALILACSLVLVPAHALAEGETKDARVRLFQVYDVEMSGLENTFTYLIDPQESDAPLPTDDEGNAMRQFSMRRDDELWLEFVVPVSVSESAAELRYHYILRPEKTGLSDGLYYVDAQSTDLSAGINVYYLEICVRLSDQDANAALVVPLVHIEGFDGPKVTDPGWRISHKEEKEDDSREAERSPGGVIPRYPYQIIGINGEGGRNYYDRSRNGDPWYEYSYSGDGSTSSGSTSTSSGSGTGSNQQDTASGANAGINAGTNSGADAAATGATSTGAAPSATGAASGQTSAPARTTAVEGSKNTVGDGGATPESGVDASEEDLAATADVQDGSFVLSLMGLAATLITLSFVVRCQRGR